MQTKPSVFETGEGWTILVFPNGLHIPATAYAHGLFDTDEEATDYIRTAQIKVVDLDVSGGWKYDYIRHFHIVRFHLQG